MPTLAYGNVAAWQNPPIQLSVGAMSIQQSRQAWEDYANEHKRAGLPVPPNPYRHIDCSVK
jgi:hypothetical protein